jgi:hypothetical protein
LKARKPDFYIITFPNFIPVIILRSEAKEAVVSILSKFINSNKRVLVKIYAITSRRFKNEVKARINLEKLLRIIMNI